MPIMTQMMGERSRYLRGLCPLSRLRAGAKRETPKGGRPRSTERLAATNDVDSESNPEHISATNDAYGRRRSRIQHAPNGFDSTISVSYHWVFFTGYPSNISPDFIFLTALKVDDTPLVRILNKLHYYFHIFILALRNAWGIILAWKADFVFESMMVSSNHILSLVYLDPLTNLWLLSCVYGPMYANAKKKFWLELMKLGDRFGGSWFIIGDVNFVLNGSERVGSKGFDHFAPFISNLVFSCGLINLPIQGDKFTWENHREGRAHVKSALDKGLVNVGWLNLFPKATLCSSQTCNSDHRPLCLNFKGIEESFKRFFKFEEGWARDDRSKLVVAHAWSNSYHPWAPTQIFKNIGATWVTLLQWNRL
uniref:Uncharacterized protein n=1 Tax=Cannabis sativa TaxID=3483 RepID=A0A803Q5E0_CANSA